MHNWNADSESNSKHVCEGVRLYVGDVNGLHFDIIGCIAASNK